MNHGSIINKAALHRLARAEFERQGFRGRLPNGGMDELQRYLERVAARNVVAWTEKRRGLIGRAYREGQRP